MIGTPTTLAEVAAFIAEFEGRRLPKSRWTHEGHLVAGLWYVWHLGAHDALARLRLKIRDHNDSVGTPNTDTSGYHETITRLHVESIAQLCNSASGDNFDQLLDKLLRSPMADRAWPLTIYSTQRLFSAKARREWVPPEAKASGQSVA